MNSPLGYVDPSGNWACGDAEWEQAYRDAHNDEAPYGGAVEDCEATGGIGGAANWSGEDWYYFYKATLEGLHAWLTAGVRFIGEWGGGSLLFVVQALNIVQKYLGARTAGALGLELVALSRFGSRW